MKSSRLFLFFAILLNCLTCCTVSYADSLPSLTGESKISYFDFKDLCVAKHHHSDSSCNSNHHRHHRGPFKHFETAVTINITMTIPQLSGAVPLGASVNVTPFAIAPNGKITKGDTTNVVPSNALVQPLNGIVISEPLKGNYVIGYFVSLAENSPNFSPVTIGNFSGVVLNDQVGDHTQTITFPVQTLFLASTAGPSDILAVTANFPIVDFSL